VQVKNVFLYIILYVGVCVYGVTTFSTEITNLFHEMAHQNGDVNHSHNFVSLGDENLNQDHSHTGIAVFQAFFQQQSSNSLSDIQYTQNQQPVALVANPSYPIGQNFSEIDKPVSSLILVPPSQCYLGVNTPPPKKS